MSKKKESLTEIKLYPEEILIDELIQSRRFPRTPEQLQGLMLSIETHTQLQPILVRRLESGQYQCIAGFGRVEAIERINSLRETTDKEALKVNCYIVEMDDYHAFLSGVSENRDRARSSSIDEAYQIQILEDRFGKTPAEIAFVYGKTEAWVSQRKTLLLLDESGQKRIHFGEMTTDAGYQIAHMEPVSRAIVQEEIAREVEPGEKVRREHVNRAARVVGQTSKRTAKEIKEFLEIQDGPGNKEGVREICKGFLYFAAGEVEEEDFLKILVRWTK